MYDCHVISNFLDCGTVRPLFFSFSNNVNLFIYLPYMAICWWHKDFSRSLANFNFSRQFQLMLDQWESRYLFCFLIIMHSSEIFIAVFIQKLIFFVQILYRSFNVNRKSYSESILHTTSLLFFPKFSFLFKSQFLNDSSIRIYSVRHSDQQFTQWVEWRLLPYL
jgi:hypothetical protein